jgi:hypothetical protein
MMSASPGRVGTGSTAGLRSMAATRSRSCSTTGRPGSSAARRVGDMDQGSNTCSNTSSVTGAGYAILKGIVTTDHAQPERTRCEECPSSSRDRANLRDNLPVGQRKLTNPVPARHEPTVKLG